MVEKQDARPIVFDIRKKILNYVDKRDNIIPLTQLLKNQLKKGVTQGFLINEIGWLMNHVDVIPKILDSPVCSGLFYIMYEEPSINMYKIAKKLAVHYRSCLHWKERLIKVFLVKVHETNSWGREVQCFLNKQEFPNLIELIKECILKQHGNALGKLISKNVNVSLNTYLKWKGKRSKKSVILKEKQDKLYKEAQELSKRDREAL